MPDGPKRKSKFKKIFKPFKYCILQLCNDMPIMCILCSKIENISSRSIRQWIILRRESLSNIFRGNVSLCRASSIKLLISVFIDKVDSFALFFPTLRRMLFLEDLYPKTPEKISIGPCRYSRSGLLIGTNLLLMMKHALKTC